MEYNVIISDFPDFASIYTVITDKTINKELYHCMIQYPINKSHIDYANDIYDDININYQFYDEKLKQAIQIAVLDSWDFITKSKKLHQKEYRKCCIL